MTLNLSEPEMRVLEELARKKDLSKTGVMKLALRLLQTVDARVERIRTGNPGSFLPTLA